MVRINGERLLDDLRALREFGRVGPGVVRQALSDVDIESRHWLCGTHERGGARRTASTASAPVIGRSRGAGKALLVGSHTDTPSPPGAGSTARWG